MKHHGWAPAWGMSVAERHDSKSSGIIGLSKSPSCAAVAAAVPSSGCATSGHHLPAEIDII